MQHDAHQSPPAWISTYAPSTALDADMSRDYASVRGFHPRRAGCLTIGGGPQPSRYRAIRHKSLRLLSLAQCFPASWPNRLFRRTCSGPIHKPPSSFRPGSPKHQRLSEFLNADGRESCDDSRSSSALCEGLGGSTRYPAAPAEPHDRQSNCSGRSAPQYGAQSLLFRAGFGSMSV